MTSTTALRLTLADLALDTRSDTFAGDRVQAMNAAADAGRPDLVDVLAAPDPDEGGTVEEFRTALRTAVASLA